MRFLFPVREASPEKRVRSRKQKLRRMCRQRRRLKPALKLYSPGARPVVSIVIEATWKVEPETKVVIAKNRHGPVKIVSLHFTPTYTRFDDHISTEAGS